MADAPKIDRSKIKRAGDLNPDLEIGETLEDANIEGVELIITSVAFDERTGDNGLYTLVILDAILPDDKAVKLHTSGIVVKEAMDAILSNIAPGEPFLATFTREQSRRNPRNRYWTVK